VNATRSPSDLNELTMSKDLIVYHAKITQTAIQDIGKGLDRRNPKTWAVGGAEYSRCAAVPSKILTDQKLLSSIPIVFNKDSEMKSLGSLFQVPVVCGSDDTRGQQYQNRWYGNYFTHCFIPFLLQRKRKKFRRAAT